MKDVLCGSKCVIWILKQLDIPIDDVPKNLYFVTDIANAFVKNGVEPLVYCYKSNLYNDYKNHKLKIKQAIKSISDFETYNKIIEKPFGKEELLLELEGNYIILNVDSRIINKTKNNSGHYVILKKESEDIIVINPEKTKFTEKKYNVEEIIEMCENNGNWRIEIRRKSKNTKFALTLEVFLNKSAIIVDIILKLWHND